MVNNDDQAKINFLVFAPCVTGPLSILGSSLLLFRIIRDGYYKRNSSGRQQQRQQQVGVGGTTTSTTTIQRRRRSTKQNITTYHRLMMGISIFDIIFSIGWTLGPLPMPSSDSYPFVGAHGNTATCTLQGFIMHIGSASLCYSLMLMIYYLLVIKFQIREQTITTRWEPIFHTIPLLIYFGTGIAGFPLEVYNPYGGGRCWIGSYPPGCEMNDPTSCERGGIQSIYFGLFMVVFPPIIYTGIIILCLITVGWTVWTKYRKSQRYAFPGSESITRRRKMKMTITQCLHYGIFFVNQTIWSTLLPIIMFATGNVDRYGKHFWISVLAVIFFPLQGFFYFLIYMRPPYLTIRQKYPNLPRLKAFRLAFLLEDPEESSSSNNTAIVSPPQCNDGGGGDGGGGDGGGGDNDDDDDEDCRDDNCSSNEGHILDSSTGRQKQLEPGIPHPIEEQAPTAAVSEGQQVPSE